MKCMTKTMELAGNSYEIGRQLVEMTASNPKLKAVHTAGFPGYDEMMVEEANAIFDGMWGAAGCQKL